MVAAAPRPLHHHLVRGHRDRVPPPLRPPVQEIGLPLSITRRTVTALLVAGLLTACTGDAEEAAEAAAAAARAEEQAAAAAEAEAAAEAAALSALEEAVAARGPLVGTVVATGLDGTDPQRLGFGGDTEVDEAAVLATATSIGTQLDGYLMRLEAGTGSVDVLGAGWLTAASPAAVAALQALAAPDNPATAATYDVTVLYEDRPTIATAAVTVQRYDGSTSSVELLLDVTEDAPTLLQLAGGAA